MRFLAAAALCSLFTGFLFTAAGADSDFAGAFAGEWKSNAASGGGAYRLVLKPAAGGSWNADVTFNVGGADVTASVKEVKVTGAKVELTYDFEVQGFPVRGVASGELKGSVVSGTYKSLASDGGMVLDEGVWSAARSKS